MSALRELRGDAGIDRHGLTMPALRPLDTIAILGQFAPKLADAIEQFMGSQNTGALAKRAIAAGFVNDEHIAEDQYRWDISLNPTPQDQAPASISIRDYLSGIGVESRPWVRVFPNDDAAKLASDTFGFSRYAIWISPTMILPEEKDRISLYADSVAKWQLAVNMSALSIRTAAAGMQSAIPDQQLDNFLAEIRMLARQMDAMAAHPPKTDFDVVKTALSEAANKTAEWAGEAAAKVAEKAGEIAGHAAQGFLSSASLMTLIVAGAAVWLYVT